MQLRTAISQYRVRSRTQGRHIIGFEVQKVIAAVEAFSTPVPSSPAPPQLELPTGLFGFGEGGLIAMHSAALEPRIRCTVVSGYFQGRELAKLACEPLYRNGTYVHVPADHQFAE
jgi:hypothetical protein